MRIDCRSYESQEPPILSWSNDYPASRQVKNLKKTAEERQAELNRLLAEKDKSRMGMIVKVQCVWRGVIGRRKAKQQRKQKNQAVENQAIRSLALGPAALAVVGSSERKGRHRRAQTTAETERQGQRERNQKTCANDF